MCGMYLQLESRQARICALSALSVSMVDGTAAFQIITRRYEIVQLSLPLL